MEDRVKKPRKKLADLLAEASRGVNVNTFGSPPKPINGIEVNRVFADESGNLVQHQIDAMTYLADIQVQSRLHRTSTQKTLSDFSDADLVMEMIKRGYAAMKLPKDGGPPETLR